MELCSVWEGMCMGMPPLYGPSFTLRPSEYPDKEVILEGVNNPHWLECPTRSEGQTLSLAFDHNAIRNVQSRK